MRKISPLLIALALFLLSPALNAYTIVLKDGSRIIAEEKYTVEGERAIIVLQNGTRTFIEASQIDVARTEKANESSYGSAVLIEGGQARGGESDESLRQQQPREQSLGDLIKRRREERAEEAAPIRRDTGRPAQGQQGPVDVPVTQGGWPDLTTMPRRPFSDGEIATELEVFLRGQGLQGARVFQGTVANRPFLELPAASEGMVFAALQIAANALLEARDRFGDQVSSLELLMLTPTQEKGGQFVLTPEMAEALLSNRIEKSRFFVEYVQF